MLAAYKTNLVMAPLVTKINHVGKKGDTIHLPKPTRGSVNAKTIGSQVTLNNPTHNELLIVIDKHFEYSIVIEDILEIQALPSMRRFFTDDAGYALAKQVDTDLIQLGRNSHGGDGTNAYTGGIISDAAGTAYNSGTNNAVAITDAGIRAAMQILDDQDVPLSQRSLIIPPTAKNDLLGINRFTEQAFIGSGDAIRTGRVGEIYGVEVYVTTNADTAAGNTGTDRVCLLMHKDAFILAEQMGVRSQAQYKQEYLGTLFTSDTIYGVTEQRDEAAVAIVVPA